MKNAKSEMLDLIASKCREINPDFKLTSGQLKWIGDHLPPSVMKGEKTYSMLAGEIVNGKGVRETLKLFDHIDATSKRNNFSLNEAAEQWTGNEGGMLKDVAHKNNVYVFHISELCEKK